MQSTDYERDIVSFEHLPNFYIRVSFTNIHDSQDGRGRGTVYI